MVDVVALGELLIDFTPKGISEAGHPIMHAIPGGAPGNFLAALARCGKKTAFIGKVGKDTINCLIVHNKSTRNLANKYKQIHSVRDD